MSWMVVGHPDFDAEVLSLPENTRAQLYAAANLLESFGPLLGRPHADTLKGSRVPNLKELRCVIDGDPWRIAYAFDPARHAVLLVAGCKAGVKSALFYRRLIRTAELRLDDHFRQRGWR